MKHAKIGNMYISIWNLVVISGVHFVTSKHTFGYTDSSVMIKTVGIIMLGAMLGFMLELSEFLLLSFTSGLTLIIAGVIKVGIKLF